MSVDWCKEILYICKTLIFWKILADSSLVCPTSPWGSGSTFQRSFCQFAWCRQRSGSLALLRSHLETSLNHFYPQDGVGFQDSISLLLAFNWHSYGVFLSAFFCQLISKLQHLPLHILPLWAQTHLCLTLQSFYFQMLLLCLDPLLAPPPHNPFVKQITFHFVLPCVILFSAIFCPVPFLNSEFLSLQLCYKTIVDTKPRHTVWKSCSCLESLYKYTHVPMGKDMDVKIPICSTKVSGSFTLQAPLYSDFAACCTLIPSRGGKSGSSFPIMNSVQGIAHPNCMPGLSVLWWASWFCCWPKYLVSYLMPFLDYYLDLFFRFILPHPSI